MTRNPMHPEALELLSDTMLELAGRDNEYPAYTERQIARKTRRSNRRRWMGGRPYSCAHILLSAELDDLSDEAELATEEAFAWRMYMEGVLPDEVAVILGTTRPRAVRLINTARNRVEACGSKSRGLYSAYLSLVHRCTYQRPI
jgi:hypothetical protein